MKTQEHIIEVMEAIRTLRKKERNETKKKILKSYILIFDYILDDTMTIHDLEREMRDVMR
jgi:hypothetical protein